MTHDLDTWKRETEEVFGKAKAYNSTIITVGYGTFFACLFYLRKGANSVLVFWALIAVIASAVIFVAYEIVSNIQIARTVSKTGEEGKRFYRYWPRFFVPSLLLGVTGVSLLVVLLLGQVGEAAPGEMGLRPGDRIRVDFANGPGAIEECTVLETGESWISVERSWFAKSPSDGQIRSRGELRRSEKIVLPTRSIRAVAFLDEPSVSGR